MLVRQEPPARIVERRAGKQREVRVAVIVDFLDVVLELVPDERGDIRKVRVPVILRELRKAKQLLVLEVVTHEVGLDVEHELSGQTLGAGLDQFGLARLGGIDLEHG